MGVVFLAERCDGQFEQRVALKVARLGLAGDEAIRRFLAERRILAGLEHPQIARLLDGGVTPEGLPFFAMEYVEGVPIGDYCDARGLSLSQRIELFLGVCAAVDHAHRRLVVHRDLKPSNILVTASGDVKLLDFGIAKLLGDDDEGTRTLERHLTPAYAAPEQIRGERVTTATDVWALGVVLYELLVGRRPFSARGAREEAALAVAGEEPIRPSAAVPATEPRAPSRRRLRRALRGDLDTILLTALRRGARSPVPLGRGARRGSPAASRSSCRSALDRTASATAPGSSPRDIAGRSRSPRRSSSPSSARSGPRSSRRVPRRARRAPRRR